MAGLSSGCGVALLYRVSSTALRVAWNFVRQGQLKIILKAMSLNDVVLILLNDESRKIAHRCITAAC